MLARALGQRVDQPRGEPLVPADRGLLSQPQESARRDNARGELDEAQALIARPPLPVVAPGVVCCARPALGRRERAAAVLGVS